MQITTPQQYTDAQRELAAARADLAHYTDEWSPNPRQQHWVNLRRRHAAAEVERLEAAMREYNARRAAEVADMRAAVDRVEIGPDLTPAEVVAQLRASMTPEQLAVMRRETAAALTRSLPRTRR